MQVESFISIFSASFGQIWKISVPIIKRISQIFRNTPYFLSLCHFEGSYSQSKITFRATSFATGDCTYYFIKLSSGKESLLCIMSAPLCDWRDICHVLVNDDGVNLVWQLRCSLRCNLRSLDTKTIYYVYYSSISSNLVYLYLMNDNESPIGVTRPSIIFTVFVLCWIHRAVSELKC